MAYRGQQDTFEDPMRARLSDMEQRLRRLEEARNALPDPGWTLVEDSSGLHYLFVPTSSLGPVIGTR